LGRYTKASVVKGQTNQAFGARARSTVGQMDPPSTSHRQHRGYRPELVVPDNTRSQRAVEHCHGQVTREAAKTLSDCVTRPHTP